ncbi:MAG TPA: Ig-like domain-containing protein [Steroidobacteraceae bacterium]|nr:Ig-like domain-containing protein [Steroidobacteraceae bacterium]
MRTFNRVAFASASAVSLLVAVSASAAPVARSEGPSAEHARIVTHWTPERRAGAIPRDLVIDERGYGYLRMPDGSLQPYGHTVAASVANQRPMAKPGGGDVTGPTVTNLDPPTGATIGYSYTFRATVTDASGIRSVSFKVGRPGARQQSFSATAAANGQYTVQLSGFSDGTWTWSVVAKDTANNTTTSPTVTFTVDTSGGGGGGGGSGDVVASAEYTGGGAIQNAAGRIYFEMPSNAARTRWGGYVCSGTVVKDSTSGRSVIQTAAHCVYDDANKAFARNVLFIPNQDGTTGAGTDLNCSNDPLGCWTPWFGAVDVNWTTRTFPDNIPWDYAYYVVKDTGAHSGTSVSNQALDGAVTSIPISFSPPDFDVANSSVDYTTALGYSYSEDPHFMYCAEDMAQLDAANWWLGSCGLSGGSSGGPWMQPFSNGTGSLISVNSWGYTNQPGMAGPKLSGTSAECVFGAARTGTVTTTNDGDEGIKQNCP